LKHGPSYVGVLFVCENNQLTSLAHCPQIVGGDFHCAHNCIESLEFCPKNVEGYFFCDHNPQLSEYQHIDDFKEIYAAHLEIVRIKLEKNNLFNALSVPQGVPIDHKNHKI